MSATVKYDRRTIALVIFNPRFSFLEHPLGKRGEVWFEFYRSRQTTWDLMRIAWRNHRPIVQVECTCPRTRLSLWTISEEPVVN
ncbi:hypothetical protein OG21DRAFT_1505920 [Imleria badia]|nr:hypothetical protein OG21DRAFT_1505920 [Imleria badia]